MKRTAKRILSLVLALTMMLSVASVFANAATASNVKQYKTYLQLGDSIAAGFGLPDYTKHLKNGELIINTGNNPMFVQYLVKGSYAQLLAKDVQATKVYPYAAPGFRSSEIRMLIDPNYNGDWVCKGDAINELSMGAYTYNQLIKMKPYYQKAVKDADLITIDVGMNDTWFSVVAAVLTIGYAINGEDVSEVLRSAFNYFGSWDAVMNAFGTAFEKIATVPGLTALLVDGVRKFWVDFYVNYTAIVDYIYSVNPDVTVVSVGCYNSFKDWELPIYLIPQTSCYIPMNALKAGLANSHKNYYFADVGDTEVVGQHMTLPLPNNISLDDSGYNPHPTANGYAYMEKQILSVLPTGKRSSNWGGYSVYPSSAGTGYSTGNTQQDTKYAPLTKVNGTWAYRVGGKVQTNYTGLGQSEYGIYYVKKGVVDFSVSGIVNVDGIKYYVKKNKVQTGYTGIVKTNATSYYVRKGVVQTSYNGLVSSSGKQYYVKRGIVQTSYTGIVKATNGSYYVKNGVVDTSYSGTVTTSTKIYTVSKGKVTATKNR